MPMANGWLDAFSHCPIPDLGYATVNRTSITIPTECEMQGKHWVYGLLFSIAAINAASYLAATANKPSIRNFDFKHYFLTSPEFEYSQCPEGVKESCEGSTDTEYCPDGLSVSVTYIETPPNSPELAIVTGSSCFTGTAGPDINGIYTMQENGQVKEIPLPRIETPIPPLLGNQNWEFSWENDRLVEKHTDSSGRENPLLIRYQWKNGKFYVDSVEADPMHQTSYDCSKAKEEHEQVICYDPELAKLDIQLDAIYKKQLAKASPGQKGKLIKEQRQWITARNKKCTSPNWWIGCLEEQYTARISELESPQ
jgi:uncharacterized protein YecT (DUF1311 family)